MYNLEALPFTFGHYVIIELADKLSNSVTVCFCTLRKYVFHIGCKREPNACIFIQINNFFKLPAWKIEPLCFLTRLVSVCDFMACVIKPNAICLLYFTCLLGTLCISFFLAVSK